MKFDILAQLALEPDAEAVADDQHPQHQFGIDRRPTNLAVERFQLLSELDQNARHDRIEAAQEVALRNALFEVERVEQPTRIARLPSHHYPSPRKNPEMTESQLDDDHEPFFNSIGQSAKNRSLHAMSASPLTPEVR